MLIVVVVQTIVLAAVVVLLVSLLKSHAAILRRLHEAGLGDPLHDEHEHGQPATAGGGVTMSDGDLRTRPEVPGLRSASGPLVDVSGARPNGSSIAVGIEGARHVTLLAFLSSGCITCGAFWDAFRAGPDLPGGARLVIVTQGTDRESAAKVAELAPATVTTVMSSRAWDDYGVPGSPYFVLAGPSGRLLGEGSAMAWTQVEELIERALGDRPVRSAGERPGARERGARRWKDRERDTDAELLAAGIRPGDPGLHHEPPAPTEPAGVDDGTD